MIQLSKYWHSRFQKLDEKQEGKCHLCKRPISINDLKDKRWRPTLDHIIPRSKGGGDSIKNLAIAHKVCNEIRGNDDIREPEYYIDLCDERINKHNVRRKKLIELRKEVGRRVICRNGPNCVACKSIRFSLMVRGISHEPKRNRKTNHFVNGKYCIFVSNHCSFCGVHCESTSAALCKPDVNLEYA